MDRLKSQYSPYASFAVATTCVADIAPVDYFFANGLIASAIAKQGIDDVNKHQIDLLFHLFMALSHSAREGHTCLPIKVIANHPFGHKSDANHIVTHQGFTFPSTSEIESTLAMMDYSIDANKGIVFANQCLYIRRYFMFECELERTLKDKVAQQHCYSNADIQSVLSSLFPDEQHTSKYEIDWQKVAVANAINKKFSIIAGGPGTGKTYTVTKLLAALVSLSKKQIVQEGCADPLLKISLIAPTGKAAQRLTESIAKAISGFRGIIDDQVLDQIPTEAQTLHRFLGVIPNQIQFKHHQDNLIDVDLVIVDEVSMVDLALMTRLFRALPQETQVIMLGDADQLPSVALGSILSDIAKRPHPGLSDENLSYIEDVASQTGISAHLKSLQKGTKKQHMGGQPADYLSYLYKSRRFDGEGGIGMIANAVISGFAEQAWQTLTTANTPDHELSYVKDLDTSLSAFVDKYYKPLLHADDLKTAFAQLALFRILTAARKGDRGVEDLNTKVAQLLGKDLSNPHRLYHGLPIMVNENNYALGLYNGDIGLVWRNENDQLVVAFESDQGFMYVMPTRLPRFEPVYAMTIHKTQGSEFEHVYIVLANQQESKLLSRELLYTGITRAKKQLSITASPKVWYNAVDAQVIRYANLTITPE